MALAQQDKKNNRKKPDNFQCAISTGRSVTHRDPMWSRRVSSTTGHAIGDKTKSEALGFGEAEFVPWQIGVQM